MLIFLGRPLGRDGTGSVESNFLGRPGLLLIIPKVFKSSMRIARLFLLEQFGQKAQFRGQIREQLRQTFLSD